MVAPVLEMVGLEHRCGGVGVVLLLKPNKNKLAFADDAFTASIVQLHHLEARRLHGCCVVCVS